MRSELTRMLRSQPFVPFKIRANDGRTFDVTHVDWCMVTPNAAYVYVQHGSDENFDVVRLAFNAITSLDSQETAA